MDSRKIRNSLLLFLAAFIWGIAFVAQSKGMDYIGPFSFNFYRNCLASISLIPVMVISDRIKGKKNTFKEAFSKNTLICGIVCGIFLCGGTMFQQYSLSLGSEAGKAGFITSLYILFVPILCIVFRKKVHRIVWIVLPVAILGLYLLCATSDIVFRLSDVLALICAVLFACQIISIDKFSSKVDSVKLAWLQFVVSALICLIPAVFFEKNSFSLVLKCAIPLLYTGIFSSGVAYTLQIVGQKRINPTIASLIMSFESVFSALAGYVILKESLSIRQILGCLLVFLSIVAVQITPQKKTQ